MGSGLEVQGRSRLARDARRGAAARARRRRGHEVLGVRAPGGVLSGANRGFL